jgi:transcriptional regulator with GAF, ATPase, and Fis domain
MINHKQSFFGLVGETPQMRQVKAVIKQVAGADITVLISGESGTGKELVAHAIHELSARARFPLVTVNCGAIPEGIFESEIFGHVRGAFTSADRTRKGYFEMADGGTVFLDEIGEMPLEAQAKILRVIEMGEFMKVGSSQGEKANVRVIAATNRDLAQAVGAGQFRQDLFFRLKAVNILLPPLRERRDDIPLLVNAFLEDISRRHKIHRSQINNGAMTLLKNAYWEGNVRELNNFLESLVILERGSSLDESVVGRYLRQAARPATYLPVHVPRGPIGSGERDVLITLMLDLKRDLDEIKSHLFHRGGFPVSTGSPGPFYTNGEILPEDANQVPTLEEVEKEQIQKTLREARGNRRKAASTLGISERTLYRKIKEYGL